MSGILDVIGGLFKPVAGLIDDLHTSGEEKLAAKEKLLTIQAAVATEAMKYEAQIANEQGQTIRAEATGHSWMQRNWRPILMLLFGYIIAHNYVVAPVFGVPFAVIPEDLWGLIKIGLGGYVIGRTAEKIVPTTISALKAKEE